MFIITLKVEVDQRSGSRLTDEGVLRSVPVAAKEKITKSGKKMRNGYS